MKKLFISLISFAIFVVAAIVTVTHTSSAEDKLLREYISALADDTTNAFSDGDGFWSCLDNVVYGGSGYGHPCDMSCKCYYVISGTLNICHH